jgi:hypothetical protein
MTNPKLQIPNKLQALILNNQNDFVWDFRFWKSGIYLGFGACPAPY